MSIFAKTLADRVEGYIALRRSLGYAFQKQASILRALVRYVEARQLDGPLTRGMAIAFIFSWEGTANGRAVHHAILRRFCEYLAIFDARTEALDPRALPRSRAISPPRTSSTRRNACRSKPLSTRTRYLSATSISIFSETTDGGSATPSCSAVITMGINRDAGGSDGAGGSSR